MPLEATVVGMTRLKAGAARLTLDVPGRVCPGEALVLGAPRCLSVLLGRQLWAGSHGVYCGRVRVGEVAPGGALRLYGSALRRAEETGEGLPPAGGKGDCRGV